MSMNGLADALLGASLAGGGFQDSADGTGELLLRAKGERWLSMSVKNILSFNSFPNDAFMLARDGV